MCLYNIKVNQRCVCVLAILLVNGGGSSVEVEEKGRENGGRLSK